eukprot:TRINITY_DN598_c0_g1_i3.p1 TRINITY_DN598_c0_g1~~TRINITY_DN598_c0_g1_i3.p1  ORF type:complete len:1640 (+),score=558.26 TRINITY_DN598_c0_g1_i3:85-4920(+)
MTKEVSTPPFGERELDVRESTDARMIKSTEPGELLPLGQRPAPSDTASLWSKLFVLHVVPIMRLAQDRTITEDDIGGLPVANRAKENHRRMMDEWNAGCALIGPKDFTDAFEKVVQSDAKRELIKEPGVAWAPLRRRVEAGEFKSWKDWQEFHEAVQEVVRGSYTKADPDCPLCAIAAAVPSITCPLPRSMPKIKGLPTPSKTHAKLGPVLEATLAESTGIYPSLMGVAYRVNRKLLWWGALWGLLQGSTVFANIFLIPEMTKTLSQAPDDVLLPNGTVVPTPDPRDAQYMGYVYSAIAFGATVAMSFGMLVMFTSCLHFAEQLRAQLATALHSKALRLSKHGWKQMGGHGKIFNLLNTDVDTVFLQSYFMMGMVLYLPVQMVLAIAFLFYIVSWTTCAGLVVMAVAMPYIYGVGNELISAFIGRMQFSDTRVKKQHELIEHIRGVKFFCWEKKALDEVEALRETELSQVKILLRTLARLLFATALAPYVFQAAILAVYSAVYEDLSVDALFQSVAIVGVLRLSFAVVPMVYSQYLTASAALYRVGYFLMQDETKCPPSDPSVQLSTQNDGRAEIRNANFRWLKKAASPTLRDVNIRVGRGELVMVVGRVGCGKTSLLEGFLGEMIYEDGAGKGGFVHLGGSVAYAAQTPWVFNATLRENVLWHRDFDQDKYDEVVDSVCLGPDLDMLTHGDMTEIGEKGINLSGGQKARVSLARCVYSDPDIVLMDDPLSAVDAHVGKKIFDKVVRGILKDKTRLLVTNQLQYLRQADRVFVMTNGTIEEDDPKVAMDTFASTPAAERSTLQELLAEFQSRQQSIVESSGQALVVLAAVVAAEIFDPSAPGNLSFARADSAHVSAPGSGLSSAVGDVQEHKADAKAAKDLIQEEEIEEGTVTWRTYWRFMKQFAQGGRAGVFWTLLFSAHLIQNLIERFSQIWLGWYVEENMTQSLGWYRSEYIEGDHHTAFWLGCYIAFLIAGCMIIGIREWFYARGAIRPCRALSMAHTKAILACPMDFFDTTPIGRIITRFTFDWMALDSQVPMSLMMCITQFGLLITSLIVIAVGLPWFLCAIPLIFAGYCWILQMDKASLQLRRIFNKTKSPVNDVFAGTLHGLSTIRAFKRQPEVTEEEFSALDNNNAAFTAERFAFEWVRLRVNLLGAFIVGCSFVLITLLRDDLTPSTVGFLISQCVFFVTTVGVAFLTRQELNMAMNSIERIANHLELTPEESDEMRQEALEAPQNWPSAGCIDIKHLYVRYRPGLPLVLNDVSVRIEAGWRVGICGRTGGGKSTLLKSMFRLMHPETTLDNGIPTRFSFEIDGVPAHKLSLTALRSAMAIIPQEPVVFSGSVKRNVDPFGTASGLREIWQAVRDCHLEPHIRRRAAAVTETVKWSLPARGDVVVCKDLKITAVQNPELSFRLDGKIMRTQEGFRAEHGADGQAKWDAAAESEKSMSAAVDQQLLEVNQVQVRCDEEAAELLRQADGTVVIETGSDPLEVGVNDDSLSVGQRQLLCLARALVLRRRILLLDEATASVDVVTDALIQKTLVTKFKGVTQIAVAHRLNTIVDCDRILVLVPMKGDTPEQQGGRVAQYGRFDDLVADKEGPFRGLAKEAGLLHE